jgi:heme/copper-type cytochrome/quinol oxidase subunit 4
MPWRRRRTEKKQTTRSLFNVFAIIVVAVILVALLLWAFLHFTDTDIDAGI